jgi:hypothetical protein
MKLKNSLEYKIGINFPFRIISKLFSIKSKTMISVVGKINQSIAFVLLKRRFDRTLSDDIAEIIVDNLSTDSSKVANF